MIKMRVRQQNEVDGWQILNFHPGPANAFEKKQPIGKIGIDQDIQVGELSEKRRVPNPG